MFCKLTTERWSFEGTTLTTQSPQDSPFKVALSKLIYAERKVIIHKDTCSITLLQKNFLLDFFCQFEACKTSPSNNLIIPFKSMRIYLSIWGWICSLASLGSKSSCFNVSILFIQDLFLCEQTYCVKIGWWKYRLGVSVPHCAMRIFFQLFISVRVRIRIQRAKPMRIHADLDRVLTYMFCIIP